MPISLNSLIASPLVFFGVSLCGKSPKILLIRKIQYCLSGFRKSFYPFQNIRVYPALPHHPFISGIIHARPFTRPERPSPNSPEIRRLRDHDSAGHGLRQTASESGCSSFSSAAASSRSSYSVRAPAVRTEVILGRPSVIVPVYQEPPYRFRTLSQAFSGFYRIPYSAPLPVPTIIVSGSQSPSAHGRNNKHRYSAGNTNSGLPDSSHTAAVISAIDMTIGTKTPAILSARRAIRGL